MPAPLNTPARPDVRIVIARTHRNAENWAYSRGWSRADFRTVVECYGLRALCRETVVHVCDKEHLSRPMVKELSRFTTVHYAN